MSSTTVFHLKDFALNFDTTVKFLAKSGGRAVGAFAVNLD